MKLISLGTLCILASILFLGIVNPQIKNESKTTPRKEKPKTLLELADTISLEEKIHPAFVRAIIKVESAWNPNVSSSVKAIGLMQIMPENHKVCGMAEPYELWQPEKNIRCGIQIIKQNLKFFKNDRVKALRAYNASKRCYNGTCPKVEKYVTSVLASFSESLPILETDT